MRDRQMQKENDVRLAILLVPLTLMACDGSNSAPAAITLRPAGADPASISVTGGAQLQFANADSIDHRIASSYYGNPYGP
jgi:hypothetical protein